MKPNLDTEMLLEPSKQSKKLLGSIQAAAKLLEFDALEEHRIRFANDPQELLVLAIGILGDITNSIIDDDFGNVDSKINTGVRFAAQYFDVLIASENAMSVMDYVLLLGSVAYYLSNLPGSSVVLANKIENVNIDAGGFELLLKWIVKGDFSKQIKVDGNHSTSIDAISNAIVGYYSLKSDSSNVLQEFDKIRDLIYEHGTSDELLILDCAYALFKSRLRNSVISAIPYYTGQSLDVWQESIKHERFVKELWPAQHLIGEHEVYKGASAVVQMPTSAGKTKAVEIIIRSSMLSERSKLAIIVAPFKALCNEISTSLKYVFSEDNVKINEVTDVMQLDYETLEIEENYVVIVVTPEKLLYLLRQIPELSKDIGLIIFDEGHQFDNGTRGITYELLTSSIRMNIDSQSQIVLISAVISNAVEIGTWLCGEDVRVVQGSELVPTARSVAFTSWMTKLGQVIFVDRHNPEKVDHFVPMVIKSEVLELKGRERKLRYFPNKEEAGSIALYLGLKLVSNGSVAIFTGQKASVTKLCRDLCDKYERSFNANWPIELSNRSEVDKLHWLISENIGADHDEAKSAYLGVFAHHGNVPMGIRVAIEHAMKNNDIRFIICTSTLAQGVNLPLKYLLVSSTQQGQEKISVRDFQNLMGRAGRAGVFTEGSILFCDNRIFDDKVSFKGNLRWKSVKEMLSIEHSEPCNSMIDILLGGIQDVYRSNSELTHLGFVNLCIKYPEIALKVPSLLANKYGEDQLKNTKFPIEHIRNQIELKLKIIESIESFIMTHIEDYETFESIEKLAMGTLGYFLSDEDQRNKICSVFKEISVKIKNSVPTIEKRKVYGRSLFGVRTAVKIEQWLSNNRNELKADMEVEQLLKLVWPITITCISNTKIRGCSNLDALYKVVVAWINGKTYHELFSDLERLNIKLTSHNNTLGNIVEIFENGFGFEATLVIGAITELIKAEEEVDEDLIDLLKFFQKRLKYGLPSLESVTLFEMGFVDRVISQSIVNTIPLQGIYLKREQKKVLRKNSVIFIEISKTWPKYYHELALEICGLC